MLSNALDCKPLRDRCLAQARKAEQKRFKFRKVSSIVPRQTVNSLRPIRERIEAFADARAFSQDCRACYFSRLPSVSRKPIDPAMLSLVEVAGAAPL